MKVAWALMAMALSAAWAIAEDWRQPLPPKTLEWSFAGPFGTYDRGALQRGFQVYRQVCAACHSLNYVSFRDLSRFGGPTFSEAEAKAIAAGFRVPAEPNERGETFDATGTRLTRPGTLADHIPAPYANTAAARAANNGAAPPDLSLIVKARQGDADYVYSILTGFAPSAPRGFAVPDGKHYNPYFAGRRIAMTAPLTRDGVRFHDGTPATVNNQAKAVVTFLAWTADPNLESRHRLGFEVLAFLIFLAGLLFLSYRKLWSPEKPHSTR
jgi:ubiquinol-cytochrome c reductase cytochrome c1 subunit